MNQGRVFVCHSSEDKKFAQLVVDKLKRPDTAPWIDHEQIYAGDDVFDKIGEGLTFMDIFLFLISETALDSGWINLEVKHAAWKEAEEKQSIIRPFRLSNIPRSKLPWFLQHRQTPIVSQDQSGATHIVDTIIKSLKERYEQPDTILTDKYKFQHDPQIEGFIKKVGIGDWRISEIAALQIFMHKSETSNNYLFNKLVTYVDCPDENLKWSAIQTIECYSELNPQLYTRENFD